MILKPEPEESSMRKHVILMLAVAVLVGLGAVAAIPLLNRTHVSGATEIFASPIQAGCYIAAANDCRIHADPFTINIASGQKLVFFQLVAIQSGTGAQTVIYDFHTDQSNPAPSSGTTFAPSLVAQDFGASCGKSYLLSLQGKDSGDSSAFNLGLTSAFTCPSGMP
jgi:hypothetical protein